MRGKDLVGAIGVHAMLVVGVATWVALAPPSSRPAHPPAALTLISAPTQVASMLPTSGGSAPAPSARPARVARRKPVRVAAAEPEAAIGPSEIPALVSPQATAIAAGVADGADDGAGRGGAGHGEGSGNGSGTGHGVAAPPPPPPPPAPREIAMTRLARLRLNWQHNDYVSSCITRHIGTVSTVRTAAEGERLYQKARRCLER